jgi:hypothetical protein
MNSVTRPRKEIVYENAGIRSRSSTDYRFQVEICGLKKVRGVGRVNGATGDKSSLFADVRPDM